MAVKKYKVGEIRNGTQVLPPEQRKTILFLGDLHVRMSGIGSQKKQIIYQTCHRYNYIDVGYIQEVDPNRLYNIEDISERVQLDTGVQDANVLILPFDVYQQDAGRKQKFLLDKIEELKPDAIFHFTDPHSWYWMYQIENMIRSRIPIFYYNIWDNLPYPKYNERFYSCSDLIMNISKQTQNIVNNVCVNYKRQPWQTKYVPHGINMETFRPMGKNNADYKRVAQIVGRDKYDFIFLFLNKNIVRKQATLIMQAYKWFCDNYLTPQQKAKTCLILKTEVIYPPGMPLNVYNDDVIHDPTLNIRFVDQGLNQNQLAALYNCADVLVSYSTAEGFGLSTAEGLACGKPFIAPVIGGLQDQMGFVDQNDKPYINDETLPSNCFRTLQKHKPWVYPIWISGVGTTGSIPTPYIYEMYCDLKDLVQAMKKVYDTPKEQRQKAGLEGRQWMFSQDAKMTANWMAQLMVENIDQAFKNWKPRPQLNMFEARRIKKDGKSGIYNPIKKVWE